MNPYFEIFYLYIYQKSQFLYFFLIIDCLYTELTIRYHLYNKTGHSKSFYLLLTQIILKLKILENSFISLHQLVQTKFR